MINRILHWARSTLTITATTLAVTTVGMTSSASAGVLDFGKVGEPVDLIVGYQPYYSESWSGVVMRDQKFYEKYLPKGSTVEFAIGLQGAVIVNAMLAGKQHIGYMGDMPAIVATTKDRVADVRIVGTLGLGTDQCNIFIARMDAPKFSDPHEAIKWLDGKKVAVPKGSCTDRFAQAVFEKEGVKPSSYLNQNIEVITSGLRAGKLDAAVIWEPTAARLVEDGLARRIASGDNTDELDGGFLTMRADLIEQRPDVVKAWLNAELDAQLFLADPANANAVAKMASEQTTGFSQKTMWMSLFGRYPAEVGGAENRVSLEYTITPKAMDLITKATKFLYTVKSINTDSLRPEAVMPEFTEAILKERGLKAPIAVIKGQPESAYSGD